MGTKRKVKEAAYEEGKGIGYEEGKEIGYEEGKEAADLNR